MHSLIKKGLVLGEDLKCYLSIFELITVIIKMTGVWDIVLWLPDKRQWSAAEWTLNRRHRQTLTPVHWLMYRSCHSRSIHVWRELNMSISSYWEHDVCRSLWDWNFVSLDQCVPFNLLYTIPTMHNHFEVNSRENMKWYSDPDYWSRLIIDLDHSIHFRYCIGEEYIA